jgi:hypothetical protein
MKLEKLKGHIPDVVLIQIPGVIAKFNANTPLRLAHFYHSVVMNQVSFLLKKTLTIRLMD